MTIENHTEDIMVGYRRYACPICHLELTKSYSADSFEDARQITCECKCGAQMNMIREVPPSSGGKGHA